MSHLCYNFVDFIVGKILVNLLQNLLRRVAISPDLQRIGIDNVGT